MATADSADAVKGLAQKLDEDLDNHINEILEKNKGYKYKDGLDPDNFEEQLRLIPAFINDTPTQEDIDKSPALQALQDLKYETENPHECALSHKEDGNYHFQKKEYKKAIIAYTEGLKQKHKDQTLVAVLYTNRAASHFYLGNNRSALNDATWALKHKTDHMKAIIRGAIACFDLESYDECTEWCQKGLSIEPKEKQLLELKKKAVHQKKQKERDARKKQLKEVKNLTERNNLLNALESRGIQVNYCGKTTQSRVGLEQLLHKSTHPHSEKLHLDQNGFLNWPVYFLYPEFNQSDFIEHFEENTRFKDQLNIIFESLPPWDVDQVYTVKNLEVYFEDKKAGCLVHINKEVPLRQVLSSERFVIQSNCPGFMVLSKKSSYYKKTFELQSAEELES